MKKLVIAFALLLVVTFGTAFMPRVAVAAPLETARNIQVYQPDEAKTVAVGKDLFTFKKFMNKGTSKALSLIEITQPPQYKGAFLLEKHLIKAPEDFYVLEGEFEISSSPSNDKIKLDTGDIAHIPPSIPYGVKHIGAGQGRLLLITPNIEFPNLLEEIGTPVLDKSSIPSTSTMLDIEKITSAAKKYGIEFLN